MPVTVHQFGTTVTVRIDNRNHQPFLQAAYPGDLIASFPMHWH